MLIGSQYADNKMYRGIRHYDKLPLMSEDIHEYSDTQARKNAYIMNHIIGYGTLNAPVVEMGDRGLRLSEPTAVLIDGDVALVQSDDDKPIVTYDQIALSGITEGVVCIVGWYQHILASSTIRNYGGVENSILDNTLLDNEFGVQLSTRYQFRWTPIIVSKSDISTNSFYYSLADRSESGDLTGTSTYLHLIKFDNIFTAPKPNTMVYAESDLFLVPILEYTYDASSSQVISAIPSTPAATKGSANQLLKSESEPTGEYPEGTVWYNPVTSEFKTYVSGVGFVDSASTMAFMQYRAVQEISSDISESQDIIVPIGIDELEEGDLLQVVYEGLVLILGENYTVDYSKNTITLLDFTATKGDKVAFTVTKIIESNGATTIAASFTKHLSSIGSGSVRAHVKLSDRVDKDSDEGSGVAATPKAVYEATLLSDTASGLKYKWGVDNGMLYLEEV